jgi:hypothetical protein
MPSSSHVNEETGSRASIRGQIFDLGDPSSGHALAPTPDDLREAVSAALASAFANTFTARSLAEPVVHISLEGANR